MSVDDRGVDPQFRWIVEEGRRYLAPDGPPRERLERWQQAVLEQQERLQWRARKRFPDPTCWLWTERSLSQASDHWSARYKASLFPSAVPVFDGCTGAGADLIALARRGPVTGVDSDPAMCLLAGANAASHGLSAEVQCRNLPCPEVQAAWLHIDPDRRSGERKTTDAEQFTPDLSAVLQMVDGTEGAMVKLAPSTQLPEPLEEQLEQGAERVWIGNQGECRQQLLLCGALRRSSAGRTAVLCEPVYRAGARTSELRIERFTGKVGSFPPASEEPDLYVYDLHAVLHASRLHADWTQQQGWRALGGEHGFYTGDQPLSSQWAQCFRVLEILPWDDRRIRKWLRRRGAGTVEIKARLHRMDAAAAQRRYSRPAGTATTLLVTRLGSRVRAIAAERWPPREASLRGAEA